MLLRETCGRYTEHRVTMTTTYPQHREYVCITFIHDEREYNHLLSTGQGLGVFRLLTQI